MSGGPKHIIVTSAMRTGSTWLVDMLAKIIKSKKFFVDRVDQALEIAACTRSGLIKSHKIIDLDWPNIPNEIGLVRLVRNCKDSLLSRALYVKNIRPAEGHGIDDIAILDLLERLGQVSDKEFVSTFVDDCPLAESWLAEIAFMERGSSPQCITVSYEQMMYNAYDCVNSVVEALFGAESEDLERVNDVVRDSIRDGYKQRATYLRNQAIGVGGWESWLTVEQSERLDALYCDFRKVALARSGERWDGMQG